jgi:invasion protein IalB
MPHWAKRLFIFLAGVAITIPALAQSEVGSGQVKATFGAWKLRCAQLAGAKDEKCALVQYLNLEDKPNMNMAVIFMKSFNSPEKKLRIVAPLNVYLPAGLGLKVDNNEIGNIKFTKCWKFGCGADAVIDDTLMTRLLNGKTASFIVFPTPEYGVGFPAPLNGFSEGVKALN